MGARPPHSASTPCAGVRDLFWIFFVFLKKENILLN
jgi:hypothetical protein